ncbi:MAG: gliding motility protein GldL [Muribaculaceae bacterium]|nr:gliding motility protein GldL [Muribaculaceae bacterium]
MTRVQAYKRCISAFISSEKGQRFFNFAYSIGAAIVIWGALFKILHLPGGNALLSIGMGTEVLMFVLTAFDRPAKEYRWENVFPALDGQEAEEGSQPAMPLTGHSTAQSAAGVALPKVGELSADDTRTLSESIAKMANAAEQLSQMADLAEATRSYLDHMQAIAADMQQLHATTAALNNVSSTLLESYRAITENSANISEASRGYVDQMQHLHQNIGGLNTIYELQLRSVSSQIDSIDRVNRGIKDIRDMYEKSAQQSARYCEESEKMARNMQQLNAVYERMVHAMTVNMYRPGMPDLNGIPVTPHEPAAAHPAEQAARVNL